MTDKEKSMLRRLPVIRRARDFHLYDASGRRILDLYQDGGRAWLGHRPDGVSLQIKNTLSRGVYAPFPSSEEGKMLKAVRALCSHLGGEAVSLAYYRSVSASAESLGTPVDILEDGEAAFVLWRPGLPWPAGAQMVELHIPLPGLEAGRLIVSAGRELPAGDLPSPLMAAALNRCIWTLLNHLKEEGQSVPFYLPAGWRQKGPYCFFEGGEEEYDILFATALQEGVLLAPSPGIPSIIPPRLSRGDLSLLKKIFPGGRTE